MVRSMLALIALASGVAFGAGASAQAQELVPCAREGGFCRVPYPTRVFYGVPGRRVELFVREGGVVCSNSIFGDPAYGVPKRCAFVARRYGRETGRWDEGYWNPSPWEYGRREGAGHGLSDRIPYHPY